MTSAAAITRPRLASQFLTTPGPRRASDVVRALLAVQSQDYPGARWAVGQRATGATDADVEREFAAGRILRTHVLRPTWHFVAPEDIRWLLALTAPRVAATMATYNRQMELPARTLRRTNDAIARALEQGKALTRDELKETLASLRLGPVTPQRMAHIMMQAELDAVVCSGARRGGEFTYALLDDRVPAAALPQRDEMLGRIAARYFATRGPATLRDFSWWSGLRMADAHRAVGVAGRQVRQVTIAGTAMWTGSIAPRGRTSPTAHLLPNYDEYFIGYRDRGAIGQRIGHTGPVTGGDARIHHVAIVNGQLVGGWKRVRRGATTVVDLRLLVDVTPLERRRIIRETRRFERFLGSPVELVVRP